MLPARRRILMATGTVACALATGYLMKQDSPYRNPNIATKPAIVSVQPASVEQIVTTEAMTDDKVLDSVQDITLTSALPDLPAPRRLPDAPLEGVNSGHGLLDGAVLPETPQDPEVPQLGCAVTATTAPAPMASVTLSVEAPCYGNQRISVHHSGLIFTEITDEHGQLSVTIPALSKNAVFVVDFGHGKGAVAMTQVAGLDLIDRVAVQWADRAGLQIHAREFGAGYGDTGHVWADATDAGQGTFVSLGRDDTFQPQLAEVYSFPRGTAGTAGTVALSIEAEVTQANCGREISAQSLERRDGNALRTRDLTLSIPGCDAAGDFLVLNNLVEDLKIAAK
ncbi:hypothetical protein [Falsiruegeria mediterranea]|uniref:Translocase n=1 Tax=Falsiruegeria mediterranea M17 TaxID=1200281 RepID=A0A2R8C3U7_9RHOB|nr:hypothetical protein [Falsiruegeria mediterranea]SPJ27072.1 hypothetical protein TRM7615_00553 [Falsiruegeria mediterranea M17]